MTGVTVGQQIEFELRAIDTVGNFSGVESKTLTVPSEEPEPTRTPSQITSCTPRIDYARSRNEDPDYRRFLEVRTWLGAQLAVFCIITSTVEIERVELTGAFAFKDGDKFVKVSDDWGPFSFKPRNHRDVKIRGVNAQCLPRMAGDKEYIVVGKLKYIRKDATDETVEYVTDVNSRKSLMCPSLSERARREVAGWRYISRYREALTFTSTAAPHIQLRRELGDQPYVPPGAGHRPWAAHHLVPWNESQMRDIHALFFKCLVHPNERANGFYLRGPGLRRDTPAYQSLQQTHPQLASRTYHGDTFRQVYIQNVRTYFDDHLDDVLTAGCRTDTGVIRNQLSAIRQRLSDGTFDVGQPEN